MSLYICCYIQRFIICHVVDDKISSDIDENLNKVIQRINSRDSDQMHWRTFALKLLTPEKVTEIDTKCNMGNLNLYSRYCEIFKAWLNSAEQRTWRMLIDILKEIDDFCSVAGEIEKVFSLNKDSKTQMDEQDKSLNSTRTGGTLT